MSERTTIKGQAGARAHVASDHPNTGAHDEWTSKAETPAQAARQRLLALTLSSSLDTTKDGRAKLLREIVEYCRNALAAVPTNTPREEAWVTQEGQTMDMNRINRLMRTAEYGRHHLKDQFSTCIERANGALQQVGSRYVIASLISLALAFNDQIEDTKIYAKNANIALDALGLDHDIDLFRVIRRGLLISALRTAEASN